MLEGLEVEVERLCAANAASLRDGDTIERLHRCLTRLDAVTTRATAAFDAANEFDADGARTAAAWLRTRCGLPHATAARRVRLGRALRHLPATEAAWLNGAIVDAHVSALAEVRTPATEDALARDEASLVGEAAELRFSSFGRLLKYWAQHVDPDGTEDETADGAERRKLHLSQSFGGMWFGDVVLDPIRGSIVGTALGRIEKELFEADWAEARARVGSRALVTDLLRTAPQRRARCAGGDGSACGHRIGKRPAARAAVERVRRLRDPRRAHL